jgi:hypothetical protein
MLGYSQNLSKAGGNCAEKNDSYQGFALAMPPKRRERLTALTAGFLALVSPVAAAKAARALRADAACLKAYPDTNRTCTTGC